ncbi:hypothetical protein ACQEVF_58550 [Nonomuraea polychroma]|uniref:hypothetical protein n=1 Tax=Nonomuraea polychroma TaxID=46176 RepID=UPI003D933773
MIRAVLTRIAAIAALLITALATLTTPSTAAADPICTAQADYPYWDSPYVFADGAVWCDEDATVAIQVRLTRDGATVDSTYRECLNRNECSASTYGRNVAGNQVWCTHTFMWINGVSYPPVRACETAGWSPAAA